MTGTIPSDSTIATVWPKLARPHEYVHGVWHKADLCKQKYGNAYVRIGVTGSGIKPCYRIFFRKTDGVTEEIYGSYWDNHQPLENGKAISHNWSTEAMSLEELEAFMHGKPSDTNQA